jgi:hypothetical protein
MGVALYSRPLYNQVNIVCLMISIYFQHYLKVHAEKAFQCEKCLKGFSTEAAKKHHSRICGIKFTCSCTHAYDSYEALLTHAKRFSHTFDEKFKLYGKYVLIRNCIISKILCIDFTEQSPS